MLIAFSASEKLGEVVPVQCELTYVNHMPAGLGWTNHGDLSKVVTTWENRYSDSYLFAPEDVGFRARYRMKDEHGTPIGRLHVSLQPAYRTTDGKPIFVLNMIGRGAPSPTDLTGVFQLFDREHDWIVRGFASITTPNMHEIWRRSYGS